MEKEKSKTSVWLVVIACLLAALLAAASVTAVLLVPRMVGALDHAERTLADVDAFLASAGEAVDTAEEALTAATRALTVAEEAAAATDQFIAENSEAVAEVVDKINAVDFEALNRTIDDLSGVVGALSKTINPLISW